MKIFWGTDGHLDYEGEYLNGKKMEKENNVIGEVMVIWNMNENK